MKTKLLFVKRRFLIVLLFALMFACLIAGATTSVAYAAGEHTSHSGWKTLSGTLDDRELSDGNYVLTDDLIFTESNTYYPKGSTAENIVWCLNGHELVNGSTGNFTPTIQNSRNGRVITICDCTGKGRVDSIATYGVSFSNVSLYNIDAGTQYNTVTTIDGNTKIYSGEVDASYGDNMIIGGNTYIETGVEFTVGNDGHLIINGGTLRCDIEVTGGTCDISGGTFYGAINVSGGTCNITGGTFSSPINVSGGTCNITGGTIKTSQYYNDDPGTPQGAVVVSGDGVCNIGGTAQITGNRVDYGGAVCVNGGTCTISGNNITKNNATYGAVYVVDGTCTIESDAVISENKSFSNGGGVYVAGGECTITGTITNNKVQANGGGVYVAGGECLVAGGVQENTATRGGGVYIAGGNCTLSSSKCLIRKNTATYDGGGVYVKGGTCSIYAQSIVQENTATHNGGGVYVADSQSVFIAGTIDSNIANENGGGVCLISNASLELNGSIVNNSTATGSNPGNGGGIYCGSGCSLTLNSSITGNKAYGQGGGIYLEGIAANPCTVTFSGNATVNENKEYRKGGTAYSNNVYALNSKITFNNANALSSVQQNSIVLNTSSCTLADGTWKTDQIEPYFELQDGGEIIIAGGYYSTDPAQLFTIADTARVVQIDENSGDNNYEAAYPWAVYPVNFEYMSGRQNGSLVYDGQPIEKDTDFTLYLESSHDMPFNYWYKAQGANDSAYVLGLPADAGTYTVKVGALYLKGSYKEYWECTFDVTIAKAAYDMSGVTFEGGSFTYDGQTHSIVISGNLPTGVTVTYEGNDKVNAGEYTVTATFTGDSANYNAIPVMTAKLTIAKADYDMSGVTFEGGSFTYDGQAHSLAIAGNLPYGVSVNYINNAQVNAGEHTVTAKFTGDYTNYNTIDDMTAKLTIAKADYDMSGVTFEGGSFTYDGQAHSLAIAGNLPYGVSVNYINNAQVNAGEHTVTATFTGDSANYNAIPVMTAKLTIAKADYDMSGVTFEGGSFTYDGQAHSLAIAGNLPYGVSVNYINNAQVNAGEHTVTAKFTGDYTNYNTIDDMTAKLTIAKAAPAYTAPTDLTVVAEGTLADIALPDGWAWKDGTVRLTETGEYKAVAVYTAADTANYNPVEVELTITVLEPEGLSGGAIAGIVIGSVFGALIIAYGVCALLYKKKILKGAFFDKIYPFIKD